MNLPRRQFLTCAAAAAATLPDTASARADFPWATKETYLNTAAEHPFGIHSTRAMEEYLAALTRGPDSARDKFENGYVVTNDLHYGGSLINYRERKKQGLDVRIVAHKDYVMDFRDLERVVDRKTRLIAIALVSNINGYVHEIRKISDLAHAHGAYVYADVIQAAGAIPIDVQAMGIDFL